MSREFEQEWRGPRVGDRYAFQATTLDVVTGYPYRIGIAALRYHYRLLEDEALTMHRVGKTRLFHFEGPVESIRRLVEVVRNARAMGKEKEDRRILKSGPSDRWWERR